MTKNYNNIFSYIFNRIEYQSRRKAIIFQFQTFEKQTIQCFLIYGKRNVKGYVMICYILI